MTNTDPDGTIPFVPRFFTDLPQLRALCRSYSATPGDQRDQLVFFVNLNDQLQLLYNQDAGIASGEIAGRILRHGMPVLPLLFGIPVAWMNECDSPSYLVTQKEMTADQWQVFAKSLLHAARCR